MEEISKNDKLIFSNSKGAYSEALGEVGITSMMYFSYNIYSYTEYMKNKEWTKPRNTIRSSSSYDNFNFCNEIIISFKKILKFIKAASC